MARKITPPKSLLVDIQAWQAEVMALPAPAIAGGALLLLKMHLWRIGPIPDDDNALARITCTTPAEWRKLRKSIEPLFSVAYGEWQRADWNDELLAAYEAVNKASRAGKRANEIRWGRKNKASEPDSESDRSRTPNRIPHQILNIKAQLDQQPLPKTNPKTPKPGTNDFQPDFEADVEIAEAALGIGGAA